MLTTDQQTSHRVLIMDDEPLVLSSISLLLQSMGHQVTQTKNGDEALQAAADQSFEVAILDLMVQDGRGATEIVDEFRRLSPDCRLVLSSGFGSESGDPTAEESQFDDRLPKPFNMNDLGRLFDRLFSPA
ncbi:MAG: hypothetical protein Fues2KO_13240 [Fuerstiella sp.]